MNCVGVPGSPPAVLSASVDELGVGVNANDRLVLFSSLLAHEHLEHALAKADLTG